MNKLQRIFYKLSGHDARKESWDHEMALRSMRNLGIEIGKKQVPAPVMTNGTCRKHPLVLLNDLGHGDYACMMCKDEERNTDPMRAMHPMMSLYNEARKRGAGPQTAVQQSVRLTQDLSKLGGNDELTRSNTTQDFTRGNTA